MVSNSHLVQSNWVYKYKVTLLHQAHTAPPFHMYGTVKPTGESDSRRIHIHLIRNDSKRSDTKVAKINSSLLVLQNLFLETYFRL
jgi:hypothetical protein